MPKKTKQGKGRRGGSGPKGSAFARSSGTEIVRVPFHNYNTAATGITSTYLTPNNFGLTHLSGIATNFSYYRIVKLRYTLFPITGATSLVASAMCYNPSPYGVVPGSFSHMSNESGFTMLTNNETAPVTMDLTPAIRQTASRWYETNPSTFPVGVVNQGLVAFYSGTAGSMPYYVSGICEFTAPVYGLDNLKLHEAFLSCTGKTVPVEPMVATLDQSDDDEKSIVEVPLSAIKQLTKKKV
jgi:hypothetical protein